MNKFNAKKTVIFGKSFASTKEGMRYILLRDRERNGEIRDLRCQPVFPLIINGTKIGRYTPDFVFFEGDTLVVEEVKGGKATITEASSLRMRVFKALYPDAELRVV